MADAESRKLAKHVARKVRLTTVVTVAVIVGAVFSL